ncbi:MAG: glycosyltransferase [Candidatus Levybacteria bacterium]|nr:glycosyltransferase [Candidatus Levybacteria bacterium]
MNVVIVVPTYNEKGNIERLIDILEQEIFPKITNHKMSILVADDSSPDGTGDIVRDLMKKYDNIDINEGEKNGLGAAYIRGMTYAVEKMNADVMFEMDADLFHDPAKIPAFLEKIDEGFDFVVGTRYSQGGSIPEDWGVHRKIMSVYGNMFIRLLFGRKGIDDWTGGYRAIKKEVFLKERAKLDKFTGYTFQVGFLYNAVLDGFKVTEVPFNAKDRTKGKSKIPGIETIIRTLVFVITVRLIHGSFGKFLIVGGIGFLLQLIVYRVLVGSTLPLGVSNQLSAQLAIFSNYNLNNLWTFKKEKSGTAGSYFKKMAAFFATSNTGVFFIQSGLIQLGEILFGREFPLPYVYFVLATGVLLIYNFTMYRFVIWRKKPHQ